MGEGARKSALLQIEQIQHSIARVDQQHVIAQNHPLPDGNKRLAWQVLTMFLALNGWTLQVPTDDAVTTLLGVAAGELDEEGLAVWLRERAEKVQR